MNISSKQIIVSPVLIIRKIMTNEVDASISFNSLDFLFDLSINHVYRR